jgi:type IV secretory pathway VirB10-like protein
MEMQMIDVQGMTRWTNPPGRPTARFRIFKHPPIYKNKVCVDKGYIEVVIEPGKSVGLPSEYDDAIQKKGPDGVVQSGLAPHLVKNGDPAPVHPSLDPNAAAREEAALREKAAKEALERAEQERRAAEAERQAADARARAAEEQTAAVKAKEAAEKAETKADTKGSKSGGKSS